jgi:NDP-4-keto-2,6-dideoxyhexose 3-C-methyltransferase
MRTISNCRSCDSSKLTEILNLGEQYVSDFRADNSKPNKYPLVSVICEDCMLVQLKHSTPPQEMYHENYGFKSSISDTIREDLDDIVTTAFQWVNDPKEWLDIASNDGTLLSFVPKSVFRAGVDPVKFLCKEAKQHASIIYNSFFTGLPATFDVITSISCFYDMDDPNTFVSDVKNSMDTRSIWIVQQNYLLSTMQLNAVDNFCLEHLEYYTLLSLETLLEAHGLEVVDLSISTVNGGSIRTVIAHKGVYPVQDAVEQQRTIELEYGLDDINTYVEFGKTALTKVEALAKLVKSLKGKGKTISIIAASTRGATIWQAAGFGSSQIDYAVERNPAKVGKNFSAIDIPIISEEDFHSRPTDYAIIGPWFFAEEIMNREEDYLLKGGHFILPLPELEIV